jgi:hypothetical protein
MTHTPGPWEYQNDTITSTHGDIARVHYQSSRDKKGWDDRPLIAAAPELLEALIKMRYTFTSDGTDDQHKACCMADAAIASAVTSRREDR